MNTNTLVDLLSLTALKGAAVLLMALLLGLGLRRMAAARRYALWITAIATLAVLPLVMWALPAWRVLPQADAALEWPVMEPPVLPDNASAFLPPEDDSSLVPDSKPTLPLPVQAPAPPAFSWNISWQDVVAALPVAWMVMAGLLLLRLAHSAWRLHRLEASLRPGECAMLAQTARDLGLRRMPRLLIGPRDSVPMVWGVLKPRLLLPQGFETWSVEKQRGVLLHELAHLKRGDPLALWTAQWVKALHWFNPLVWLTLRQLRADQERACDDTVLRHGVRASDYAQSLLDLSLHNRLAPGLSLCALTITRCAPVEARVKAILDPTRRRESLNVRWLATLAGGALLITLPVAMLHAIEGPALRGRILDRNGVVLAETMQEKVRNYPLKTLAAHVIGYTRTSDETHAQIHGGAALEKQHDAELTAGKDVTLALDMRIQSLAHRAMREAGVTRGAAVVLDPRTGEILAAVSLPSFDPNLFIPSISRENWERYLSNRDVPLLDRCFRGFSPGSTFKLLTGLAGGAAGISEQKFNCAGTVTYGNSVMQCWIHTQDGGSHGMLGMSDSLAVSCNCYWYQFGNAAGIDQIESMGRRIGFGSAYGVTEKEDPGVLYGPAWMKQNHPQEKWTAGHTANASIGQGFMLATPLQMAVLAATVGNGGKVPQPGIVKQEEPRAWRADLIQRTLTAAAVEPLREGMRLAVNGDSGTGRPARSDKVVIAGKTGTAQNWRKDAAGTTVVDNNGWFIGFAPFDKPTLAFAILKNGAKSGGGDCGPIAKRIVEEALALHADGSGAVKPVEEKSVEVKAGSDFKAAPKPLQIFKKTMAKVLGRKSSASSNSLIIDKGSLDGIVGDSPVITAVGLVGKTATPEPHTTKVILLTNELCRVSAKVEGTLEQGILAGDREPQLHLRFLSRFAKINIGSNVYSSGEGGVFPADLLLGQVKQFKSGDISGEAIVEPAVDLSTLDEVFVIELKTDLPHQEAATPPKPADQAQDADILMDPQLATHWKLLQRKGFLADLPAKAVIMPSKPGNVTYGSFPFQFTASREDAQNWLTNSLGDVMRQHYSKWQPWPEKPGVFDYIYEGLGDCMIHIKTLDAETVEVRLWLKGQAPKHMLIAPDGAAPPTPKTAAPKKLSGVVSNDTQPVDEGGQMKSDFDAEEIARQIRLFAKKTDVTLGEFKNGGGRLFIIGHSDNLEKARMFGDLLTQSGKQWGIAWHVTQPQKLSDRPRMMLVAVGIYKSTLITEAISSPPSPSLSVSTAGGVVPPLSNWRTLQKFGKLADLPADYAPARILPSESLVGPMPSMMYAFTASRTAVHAWLSASLPSKILAAQADKLRELGGTEPFQHDFWGQDLCCIRIVCVDGKARVLISRMRRSFNIAPDESQKPRPAGRLAPEYRQDGLTSAEPAMRPSISPEEVPQPTFRPQPSQVVWKAPAPPPAKLREMPFPLNRLQGELSAESAKALQRSLNSGSRIYQALWVKSTGGL